MNQITNVSWRPGGDAPQMNNVFCPRCGEDCYNTWGLFEHLKTCTGPKCSPEAQGQLLAATWAETQQAVAEAEAIIAGYMPEGTVHRG